MKTLLSIISIFLFIGCAQNSNEAPVIPIFPTHKANLILFSAPWCGECAPKLHAIDSALNELGVARKSVSTTVYVVDGLRPGSHPDDSITAKYAEKIGVPDFKFVSDPWRWTTFSIYYTDKFYAIPGAVLLDEGGREVRLFDRGTFTPQEVNSYIIQTISQ